ncbi:hypothetical protein [Streptomyces oceani]|uniref:Galactose oxidase n=1 Tax=Streptomyces oceani TaxID=1075402 RepID=A0A1E7KMV5_9ACTN|nr:hypothetical protein [Streptomyces oceani]OEV05240.1 hypothetical protein AN216_03720 [Streptomyces oceani]
MTERTEFQGELMSPKKRRYRQGVTAVAAVALTVTAAQIAIGDESDGGGGQDEPENAASSWQVEHYSESLDAKLTDVAPVSGTEGWAIGEDSEETALAPVLLHGSGKGWKKSELPAEIEGKDTSLTGIEASGPDNVWLFGERADNAESAPFVYRYDGERWRKVPRPAGSAGVVSVAVVGSDDVWALHGDSAASHWDGEGWTKTKLPADANTLGNAGADQVWAVGSQDDQKGETLSQPAAMRWDGESWKLIDTPEYRFPKPRPPEEDAYLETVVPVSENEVWALGEHTFNHGETTPEPDAENILLRWNGDKWQRMPEEATSRVGVDGIAASDGNGGLLLDDNDSWHLTKDGEVREIGEHKPVPGRTGEVREVDEKQKFWPEMMVKVPGEDKVWSAGVIELGTQGDANFRRGAVLSYATK